MNQRQLPALLFDLHHLTGRNLEGGDVHALVTNRHVTVANKLPGALTGRGEPEPEDDVVQPCLQHLEEHLTRHALATRCLPVVSTELVFQDPVLPLRLLLLPQLE